MKVVVDTNVLVSSFLSSQGSPSEVLRMIMNGSLRVCYDVRILNEYAGVLARPKFHIPPDMSAPFLDKVRAEGESITAFSIAEDLPDPDDRIFLEVALASQAECLITGNLKHFPMTYRHGLKVLSPAEFLQYYQDQQGRSGGTVKSPSDPYRVSTRGKDRRSRVQILPDHSERSLAVLAREIDGVRRAEDVDWTPEEVAKVIRAIRQKEKKLPRKKQEAKA